MASKNHSLSPLSRKSKTGASWLAFRVNFQGVILIIYVSALFLCCVQRSDASPVNRHLQRRTADPQYDWIWTFWPVEDTSRYGPPRSLQLKDGIFGPSEGKLSREKIKPARKSP